MINVFSFIINIYYFKLYCITLLKAKQVVAMQLPTYLAISFKQSPLFQSISVVSMYF